MLWLLIRLTTEVCQCEVAADFDDDMVQDAMAIILFPTRYTIGIFSGPLRDHYRSWEAQTLPNPLRRPHAECNDAPSDHLKYKGQAFQQVEAEAIACVQSYVELLHRAISMQSATAGKQGRNHIRMWYNDLRERKWDDFMDYNYRILGFDPLCEEDKHYTEVEGISKVSA
ncbi:hypothetical protein GGR55DRAFT_692398 [Xylaria sp. FL0064]|nr:hypothetical protein GGR55DRAFT_692398 [Xylaria sp. FL0064]